MSLVPTASDLPDLPRQHHRDGACNVTWVAVMHPTLMLGLHRRPVALVSDQAQSRVMVSHAQSCWLPLMRAAAMNQVRKILDRGRYSCPRAGTDQPRTRDPHRGRCDSSWRQEQR